MSHREPVFTPPRDDFAGLANPTSQASDGTALRGPHDAHHETRQAVAMVSRVIGSFIGIMLVIILCYFIEGILIKDVKKIVCDAQPIDHGKLLPGFAGSKAVVDCDKGYVKGAPVKLICYAISEKCVVIKKATVTKEAVKRCWRKYAYLPKTIIEELKKNRSAVVVKEVAADVKNMIPHACLPGPDLDKDKDKDKDSKSKLYLQQRRPEALHAHHEVLTGDYVAIFSMLVIVSVALTLLACIARAKADDASFRRLGTRPLSAVDDDYDGPPSAVDDDTEVELYAQE